MKVFIVVINFKNRTSESNQTNKFMPCWKQVERKKCVLSDQICGSYCTVRCARFSLAAATFLSLENTFYFSPFLSYNVVVIVRRSTILFCILVPDKWPMADIHMTERSVGGS